MLALYICLLTGLVVWLWLVWDMTREVRAGWGRGASLKVSRKKAPEPEPEPSSAAGSRPPGLDVRVGVSRPVLRLLR